MKKTVLVFGLIAGVILSLWMLLITVPFHDRIGFDRGMVLGYASMVLAFMLVFFGIRSYRDNVGGGRVSFGRALAVGALISIVASTFYVATWEVIYYTMHPDFIEKYGEYAIAKERAAGASEEAVAAKRAELQKFAEMYRNPVFNVAMTYVEPLPIGLIMSLVSAGILSRRRRINGASPAGLARNPSASFQ